MPHLIPLTLIVAYCLLQIPAQAEHPFSEQCQWIALEGQDHNDSAPAPYFRKSFSIEKPIHSAILQVTAKGMHETSINGKKVSDAHFLPGWTDYNQRIYYHEMEVTDLLRSGENVIGSMVGDGWYAGYLGFRNTRQIYGTHPELLLQLVITFEDGSEQTILTDRSWKSSEGAIQMADIYNGEDYDSRLEPRGWNQPGFDDSKWSAVGSTSVSTYAGALQPAPHTPVREQETLMPVEIWQTASGSWVFDLGQNMVGKPLITVPSIEGQKVTVRFAEMLNDDRTIYTDNYRRARSTDTYICTGGQGFESYMPFFTFHGFRYVELSGFEVPVKPTADWVRGVVLHTDIKRIGTFECSNPDLNQLQSNIVWGQKGNFLEVPTDCPQRDERLGWTGDAQVFAPTASYNFDVCNFFNKWMIDMRDAQREDGAFPHVAPNVLNDQAYDSPAWADAGVIIPWEVYVRYGDQKILEENYEAMMGWINYMKHDSPGFLRADRGYGDWLQPYPLKADNKRGDTARPLIGTAYFAYSTSLLQKTATVLGKTTDAEQLAQLLENVKQTFQSNFVSETGELTSDTQTACLLALAFDLLPEKGRPTVLKQLLRLIDEADGHLRTGFVGTPLLTQVLTRFGHTDLAYDILLKETYPGWIYSIRQGATTMWERWNSYTLEDGFNPEGMNSFNHYAYGAIGQWMYETVAGLKPDPMQPGYQHFWVAPQPGGELTFAKAELETANGLAGSHWRTEGDSLVLIATVPDGAKATVVIPEKYQDKVIFKGETLKLPKDRSIPVEAGVHTFVCVK